MSLAHDATEQPDILRDTLFLTKKHGWPVVPLRLKIPLIKDWPRLATSDAGQIREWAGKYLGCNFGLVTGKRSGILVLDVDLKSGGPGQLDLLEMLYDDLPPTPTVKTGGGGRQYYFRYPHGRSIKNAVNFSPGLDIRTTGGQVVLPPGRHESGGVYGWAPGLSPDEVNIAEAPEWLLDLMEAASRQGEATAPPVDGVIAEGTRNSTLTSLAGTMRQRGFGHDEILAALTITNENRCDPPVSDEELKTIIDSVVRYKPGDEFLQSPIIKPGAVVCRLSDVEPEEVAWLWEPYFPLGKITLIEGDPGDGKTMFMMATIAPLTNGGRLPGRDPSDPVSVIYLTAEDGLADTIRPRLDSLSADVGRVHAITGVVDEKGNIIPWTMKQVEELEVVIKSIGAKLVVIDPLQAFLGADVDFHKANETRPRMSALVAVAERMHCAIVCIRHLSKAVGNKAIYRGMGSIDFTAVARSVLLIGKDQNGAGGSAMVHIKSSLAPAGPAQGFSLTRETGFSWLGESTLTAADICSSQPVKKDSGVLDYTVEWLTEFLSDGPKEFPEIDKAARRQDIKPRTLRRAREELMKNPMFRIYKKPGVFNGPWIWEISDDFLS